MKIITEIQETVQEDRALRALKRDLATITRTQQKNDEAIAATIHQEILEQCGSMRLTMDKLVKDQIELSTKVDLIA